MSNFYFKLFSQIVAIEVVIHIHNDDSVAAADTLSTAFGYVCMCVYI